MKIIKNTNPWMQLALVILFVAICARLSSIMKERFNYDEYSVMFGVEKSFSEYTNIWDFYNITNLFYPWISYRIFGEGLTGYRILPFISSVAVLLIFFWSIRKFWHSRFDICFFTILVLAFSKLALFFAGYSTFAYSNSLLVSCILFFISLKLSQGSLTRKQWLLVIIITVPMTFFTHPTIVVFVALSIISVIIFRIIQSSNSRNIKAVWQSIWEMKALYLLLLVHLIVWKFFSSIPLRESKNLYYIDPFMFHRSQYTKDILGALHFIIYNTSNLFATLLLPMDISKSTLTQSALLMFLSSTMLIIMAISLIVSIIIQFKKRELDPKISFTLMFTILAFLSLVIGGLLDLYPFGFSRYTYWLLIPLAMLIGHSLSFNFSFILNKVKIKNSLGLIPVTLTILILLGGSYVNLRTYLSNMDIRKQNALVFQNINNISKEYVALFSHSFEPILRVKALDIYSSGYSIGDELRINSQIPDDVTKTLKGNNPTKPANKILVIISNENVLVNSFPLYSKIINEQFKYIKSLMTPLIWVGYYERNKTPK